MIVFPNAKINIGLNIISKRPDGYHNLETLFYPIKLSDALEMAETGKTGITFTGIAVDCDPDDNLVMKAYKLLKADYELPPVQFHLHKVIPSGAGLGGGSSDAAFTLKLLNDYFRLNIGVEKLKEYAVRLGADCAFFIDNKPALGTGIGNQLEPLSLDLSHYELVILKPEIAVSTVQAYSNIVPANPSFSLSELPELDPSEWKSHVVNDFEKNIFRLFPEIEQLKRLLYDEGAVYASMSGSGSAVYGFFTRVPSTLKKKIPKGVFFNA